MAIQDDWTITYGGTKTVEHTSGTTVYTVLEYFQWLAAEFASASQMDDEYAFVSDTPTVYRWVNDWAFGAPTTDYKFLSGGGVTSSDATAVWANLYSIGTQETGTLLYIIQNDVEVTPWWTSGNIDILVNVKTGGAWIQSDDTGGTPADGGIWVYARESGDSFDHNFVDLSGGGRNPVGINTASDSGNTSGDLFLTVADETGFTVDSWVEGAAGAYGQIAKIDTANNYIYLNSVDGTFVISETITEYSDRELTTATGESTTNDGSTAFTNVVAGYTDITDTFGVISRDLNNGNGSNNYDVEIDCAGRPMTEVFEWLKYIVRYKSTGGTYTVNSDDGQEYRSCSEGTYTDVKVAPFGTLAGTTFYGARGVWVTNYASADFVLIDASGTEQAPPDYQKVTVTHTSLSGVQIFVAEITAQGGTIIKNQYTISSAGAGTITVTTTIDINKVPQSGILRVADVQYEYTSFTGAVFTIVGDATGETGSLYVPLLDILADTASELSDNIIYTGSFWCRTVARQYGYKPYTADVQFGANGITFSPILTDDPQAS